MRELKIALGNSRQAKFWSNKTMSFDDICDRLKTPIRTTESAEEYAKLPKPKRDEIKDKGGFVGGHLRDNLRKAGNVTCRSLWTPDIDNATPEFVAALKKKLNFKCAVYSTHSHTSKAPRLRFVAPFTRDVSADEYVAISRYMAAKLGIDMFDECSFIANQLMYWPTCPSNGEYICEFFEGELIDPDAILAAHPNWQDCSLLPTTSRESKVNKPSQKPQEDPLSKSGVVGAFCRSYGVTAAIDKFLSDIYAPSVMEGRYDYISGESTAGVVLYDDKFAFSHHATDPACGKLLNAFDLVRIHKFGANNEKQSFAAMADFAVKDEIVSAMLLREKQESAAEEFDDWTKGLLRDRGGLLKNSLHNITLIMENDPQLKSIVFNQQLDGMEIKGSVPWKHPSKYWRDADDAQLISYIDSQYGTFSARNYDIAVAKVSDDRSYHPIREFLASLPKWDTVPRVDTLFIDYLGARDNTYVRAVTRKTICAAISRVKNPGCKFDTMPVLNGPQGIGKSTLIAKLAGEWFSDSLNLGDTKDKTAAEKLQGYWILEIGELAGLRKAETETLRSFISRQNDIYRAAFGKRATPHPRQCIFFGTTNAESGYLRDTTGNRRFWPIKTPGNGKKRSWELTEYDILQIWAEALVYVEQGEKLHLPPEIEALAKNEQREALEADEREGLVQDFLDALLPENWDKMDTYERRNFLEGTGVGGIGQIGTVKRTTVSNMEIWCECFCKERANLKRSDSNELMAILTKLGWVRRPKKDHIPLYGQQYIYDPKINPEKILG
ncbi:MAG: virulence-associated E family protein [Sphaerochaetaceae bacterium]|nr:virulence-associated E family protein [Sphaerochaetaceae bacterium]